MMRRITLSRMKKQLPKEIQREVDAIARQHLISPLLYRKVLSRSPLPLGELHRLIPVKVLRKKQQGEILKFKNIRHKDTYNPSLLFEADKKYLAVRVESHESNWLDPVSYDPKIMFFEPKNDYWELVKTAPVFTDLEDPFTAWIVENGQRYLVFGGVRVLRDNAEPYIATVFYKATSLFTLSPLDSPFVTIKYMKDIRLVQRSDGKLVVLTRPVGGKAGQGRIGVVVLDSLADLTQKAIEDADLLHGQINSAVKVGPNYAQLIQYEELGETKEEVLVLGHIAFEDEKKHLHYYAMTFRLDAYDPLHTSLEKKRPRIIATRESFEHSLGKGRIFHDVVFPGGMEWLSDREIGLYAGIGDEKIGYVRIAYELVSYT